MNEIRLKEFLNRKGIGMTFLFLCFIFIFENGYSRKHWNRDYMQLTYNEADTSLVLRFEFFDYFFGPANENAYLEYCDYSYSVDGVNYKNFMRSETDDQGFTYWSWLYMKNKLSGTRLQFNECFIPPAGWMWPDNKDQLVKVNNTDTNWAYLTMKWFLNPSYKNIKYIRIIGKWHNNGVWPHEYFDEVYQTYLSNILEFNSELKPFSPQKNVNVQKNNTVKVFKDGDAVVIKGIDRGEEIKVYSVLGVLVNRIVATNDEEKIELAANQIYILKIGSSLYKLSI